MAKSLQQWHFIRTAPQQEFYVNDLLKEFGLSVYTPFDKVPRGVNLYTRAKRERRRYVTKPALRGYVFVCIPKDNTAAYTRLITVLYHLNIIRGLYGKDDQPYIVPDHDMQILKEVYKRGYDKKRDGKRKTVFGPDGLMQTGREFKEGDIVRYMDGPLAEMDMRVVEVEDAQARMLMTIFGVERMVTAPLTELEKAA